jgi:DNA primase
MRFPPSFLDEIKARLPVSEVVRRRVKLMRAGREWRGLSPFNSEKTPSFFVNDQKMAWFDFSAGKNGNIFDFLMETEGLSFPEAVRQLAAEAGLGLPELSPEAEAKEKARANVYEVLELTAAYFSAKLSSSEGREARAYLETRGIADEMRARFRLGCAGPEKYALRDHLAGRGVAVEAMIEAGLLVHGEGIAVPYDRFRQRIIFPICDVLGRVIAFGGRATAKDAEPKYLNSPETGLFHKGAILYNHHNARKAVRAGGQLLVVEGYIDVISMTSAGFDATVAPLGTALTPGHCALLWQMAEEPVLCFDGDRAGRRAAYRAAEMALPLIGPSRSLRFALLPEGQDPDDFVRSSGREAVSQLLSRALPLSTVIFLREAENKDFNTPERRAGLTQRLNEIATRIRDINLRNHYRQEFKEQCFRLFRQSSTSSFANARDIGLAAGPKLPWSKRSDPAFGSALAPVSMSLAASPLFRSGISHLSPREGLILLLLINHPGLLAQHVEELAGVTFSSNEAAALRDAIIAASVGLSRRQTQDDVQPAAGPNAPGLRAALESRGFAQVLQKLDAVAAHGSHWYSKADAAEADAEEVLKQALSLHRRAKALHKELQLAELALVKDCSEANLGRLKDIQTQLSALGGIEAAREGFGVPSGRPGGTL